MLTTGFIVGISWAATTGRISATMGNHLIDIEAYISPHCNSRLLLRLYWLALAECLFDVVDKDTAALQAKLACYQLAFAVNEECGRQHANAAIALADRVLPEQDGVVYSELPGELRDVSAVGILVHGHADDLETLWAVFLLQFDKPGHLDFAWLAPGGPKIEQDGLATEIGELHALAFKRGELEVGRGLSLHLSGDRSASAILARLMNSEEQ